MIIQNDSGGLLHQVHGFAVISDNDCIADCSGVVPEALRNEADWAYFQEWLDKAALTILGRLSHQANPNVRRRKRLILSTSVDGLHQRKDGLWWNPDTIAVPQALAAGAPEGGLVAVPGGRRVFDLFLSHGYDGFHLTRACGVSLAGGVRLFSDIGAERKAEDILVSAGLRPGTAIALDPENAVSLTVFEARHSA